MVFVITHELRWHSAFFQWFASGDLGSVATLLKTDFPMDENARRFLAAILSGEVNPLNARGGPKYENRAKFQAWRILLKHEFGDEIDRKKQMKKLEGKSGPRIDVRAAALESLARKYALSESALKKIIERPLASEAAQKKFNKIYFNPTNPG